MKMKENLAAKHEKQEAELEAYLISIESAKWDIFSHAKFVYNLKDEFHDLIPEIDKFFKMLGERK